MKDILIVTGTCGVGKSTVCRRWARRRRGAAIHCDAFRSWITVPSLMRADGFQEPLIVRNAGSLTEDYMAMGLDVALDNAFTPEGLTALCARFTHKARIRVFWLSCSSQENHRRDERRAPRDVMGARVDELQAELEAMNWPGYVTRIDTTDLSADQTIEMIEESFQLRVPADGEDAALGS